jgi:hypothetical protein
VPNRKRQGARTRHQNWAADRADGLTYREIAKRARVTPMAVYLALNPDKRKPYVPKRERSPERLESRYTRLSGAEWTEVKTRAKASDVSAAVMIRLILLGREPPLGEPRLEL